ncbi:hypothetical protein BH11BAC2_BH11BAC2_03220 [soil metagenome]
MKKRLLILMSIALISMNVIAQTSERPISFGLWGGTTQYNGDLGQGIYDTDQATYGHIGLSLGWYITSHFDFSMNGTYGSMGFNEKNSTKRFKADQFQWNGHFRINLLNSDKYRVIPYLLGGIGVSSLSGSDVKPGTDFYVPFGAGVKFRITDRINLHLQETFAYTDHDTRDGEVHDNNDGFAMHSIGLTWNFAGMQDADKDGVANKNDKCPGTPMGIKVDAKGCPLDRDGDMIADYLDSCPDIKGVASANGCPDKDFDGVKDADDKCPDVAGIIAMKGCPDKDGDGITDAEDKCPDLKGTAELKGCPDSDGDGIIDPEDACPNDKGLPALNGCPDKDNDGIADKDDKCPDVSGIAANKGCPEVKEDVKQLFTKALQGIQFETGRDVIKKNSYAILNNVAKAMSENPSYLLSIDGHTDNTGDAANNLTLSQKRADAVKTYLTNKGVNAGRMTATGFGQTVPVADNKTSEGRAKNRRVAFKVTF